VRMHRLYGTLYVLTDGFDPDDCWLDAAPSAHTVCVAPEAELMVGHIAPPSVNAEWLAELESLPRAESSACYVLPSPPGGPVRSTPVDIADAITRAKSPPGSAHTFLRSLWELR
jgi:hypothetical protein